WTTWSARRCFWRRMPRASSPAPSYSPMAAGPRRTDDSRRRECDMGSSFKIAVIAGDGIGREGIPAGLAALEAAAKGASVSFSFTEFPWSCEYYAKHGVMMGEEGYAEIEKYDAIYLGAIGAPGVPDRISAAIILAIRQRFDQYVNLRPMRLLPGL